MIPVEPDGTTVSDLRAEAGGQSVLAEVEAELHMADLLAQRSRWAHTVHWQTEPQ